MIIKDAKTDTVTKQWTLSNSKRMITELYVTFIVTKGQTEKSYSISSPFTNEQLNLDLGRRLCKMIHKESDEFLKWNEPLW